MTIDDADKDHSLEMCGGDPVVSGNAGSSDGEQEVPLGSHMCPETCLFTTEKHRGSELLPNLPYFGQNSKSIEKNKSLITALRIKNNNM